MSYQLGIIGGVGSEASSYLYHKILKHTKAETDQEHLNMIILNHASIADRTAYILDQTKENPLSAFLDDITILNTMNVELIVIPCNTSHYFYNEFSSHSTVPIYHMIKETVKKLKEDHISKVGILATDGTIQSGLYQAECERQGIAWAVPNTQNQMYVMDMIYRYIKAGKDIHHSDFNSIIDEMKALHVERIILACTELSILKEKENLSSFFVDPLDIATQYVLQIFHKTWK